MRKFLYIATVLLLVSIQPTNANQPNMGQFFRCGKTFVTFYSLPLGTGKVKINGGMLTIRKEDIEGLFLSADHKLTMALKDEHRISHVVDKKHWLAFVACLD